MSDVKVTISAPTGQTVGYFLNPRLDSFPHGDYEITGSFYDEKGERIEKIEFNPEVMPYSADISQAKSNHAKLVNVYVQRGRQPVVMTGTAG